SKLPDDLSLEDKKTVLKHTEMDQFFQYWHEKLQSRNYWKVAPGKGAKYWDEFRNNNVMAIGFLHDVDYTELEKEDDIKQKFVEEGASTREAAQRTRSVKSFKEIKKGDIIFVNKGKQSILAIAEVTGDYEYKPDALPDSGFPHMYRVNWLKIKEIELPKMQNRWQITTLPIKPGKAIDLSGFFELEQRLRVWFENTALDSHSPQRGWDFKECLASPRRDEGGGDRYREMRSCEPGDLVLHYLQDEDKIVGISEVADSNEKHEALPEDMDERWASRPGYRVPLRGYKELKPPLDRSEFLNKERYEKQLKKAREEAEEGELKIVYSSNLEDFTQGVYLSMVPPSFQWVLNDAYQRVAGQQLLPRPLAKEARGIEGREENVGRKILGDLLQEEKNPDIYKMALAFLLSGKNVVFYGAPATGKTRAAELICKCVCGEGNYRIETANSEWGHHDVVGGYTPSSEGGWELKEGFLTEAADECRKSIIEGNTPYWLIVDELNRANLDQAFGKVFTLLDIDYREESPLLEKDEKEIYMPLCFRILATMNVYDKALLFNLGYAFMRRFAFIKVPSLVKEHEEKLWREEEMEAVEYVPDMDLKDIVKNVVVNHLEKKDKNNDAVLVHPKLTKVDIQERMSELLQKSELKIGDLDFIDVLLLFSRETTKNIVEIGQAIVMDAAKFIVTYSILFPDDVSPKVIDEAISAYLLPQFEYYMPQLRKAESFREEKYRKNFEKVVNLASNLGLQKTKEMLDDASERLRVI
ncbi:hypothetical protein AKJ43_03385, partial [candidate division MSBL1 archaeon SCGC-AAA261D19]